MANKNRPQDTKRGRGVPSGDDNKPRTPTPHELQDQANKLNDQMAPTPDANNAGAMQAVEMAATQIATILVDMVRGANEKTATEKTSEGDTPALSSVTAGSGLIDDSKDPIDVAQSISNVGGGISASQIDQLNSMMEQNLHAAERIEGLLNNIITEGVRATITI